MASVETEGKWRLQDALHVDALRGRLVELGAQRERQEHEINRIFDTRNRALGRSDRVLRIRVIDGGPHGRLTVKGPLTSADGIRSREELETGIDDAETAQELLTRLGYVLAVEYPKVRETWRLGALEIALDELPFGRYCEIEGPEAEIRALARELALDALEPRGYPRLMRLHLQGEESLLADPRTP